MLIGKNTNTKTAVYAMMPILGIQKLSNPIYVNHAFTLHLGVNIAVNENGLDRS